MPGLSFCQLLKFYKLIFLSILVFKAGECAINLQHVAANLEHARFRIKIGALAEIIVHHP